jgi:hypothetical protein
VQDEIDHECNCRATIHDEDFHRVAHRLVNPEDNSISKSPEEIVDYSAAAIAHSIRTGSGGAATESVRVQEVDIIVQCLFSHRESYIHVRSTGTTYMSSQQQKLLWQQD